MITSYAGVNAMRYFKDGTTPRNLWMTLLRLAECVEELLSLGLCHNRLNLTNICILNTGDSGPTVTLINFSFASPIGTRNVFENQKSKDMSEFPSIAPELWTGEPCSVTSEVYCLALVIDDILRLQMYIRFTESVRQLAAWLDRAKGPNSRGRPTVAELREILEDLIEKESRVTYMSLPRGVLDPNNQFVDWRNVHVRNLSSDPSKVRVKFTTRRQECWTKTDPSIRQYTAPLLRHVLCGRSWDLWRGSYGDCRRTSNVTGIEMVVKTFNASDEHSFI